MSKFTNLLHRFFPGKKEFPGSSKYWEWRYKAGGNSGGGSYGKLAHYKADFINAFISRKNIRHVIEWGCGDGHQASLIQCGLYEGWDISPSAIKECRKKFGNDTARKFYVPDEKEKIGKAELVLSLDVIYHLVEDHLYDLYMEEIFSHSLKHVIIYSCNFDAAPTANHVRPRHFSKDIQQRFPEWELVNVEKNPFPMMAYNDPETSWSDFYVYEKRGD